MSTSVMIHDVVRANLQPAKVETHIIDGEKYEVVHFYIETEKGEKWDITLFGTDSKKADDYQPVAPHIDTGQRELQ